jgi:hypothetical protein
VSSAAVRRLLTSLCRGCRDVPGESPFGGLLDTGEPMRSHSVLARRPSAAAALLLAILGVLWSSPDESWSDGDPASDVLLARDVFYPYEPKVSPALESTLERTLKAAARATGLHAKVAIIGSSRELGIVPYLFGHAQSYAQFLDREITFNQPQQLLVVMPSGFGAVPVAFTGALGRVPIYARQRSDGLVRSAILAVVALTRYQGHAIPTPSLSAPRADSSPPALLVYGLPVALLALGGLAVLRRHRLRFSEDRSVDERS